MKFKMSHKGQKSMKYENEINNYLNELRIDNINDHVNRNESLNELASGYYIVIANRSSNQEVAFYTKAKKWLYIGSMISFVPHKIIRKITL